MLSRKNAELHGRGNDSEKTQFQEQESSRDKLLSVGQLDATENSEGLISLEPEGDWYYFPSINPVLLSSEEGECSVSIEKEDGQSEIVAEETGDWFYFGTSEVNEVVGTEGEN